jgi:hypothetical protein
MGIEPTRKVVPDVEEGRIAFQKGDFQQHCRCNRGDTESEA